MVFNIFSGIDEKNIIEIQKVLPKPETAEKGRDLYRTGNLGIILKGSAKIVRHTEAGASVTVREIHAGEIFGAASLFGEWSSFFGSIIASGEVIVRYISEKEFKALLQEYPQIALNYITFLSDRIRFLNKRLDTFSAVSVDNKLYEYLLSIADEQGTATLNVGLAELARRLKIGRSSLYRSITNLEEAGLVKREKNRFVL